MKTNHKNLYIISVLAIVFAINIISDKLFFRIDFTSDNRYTLSNATKNILNDLEETVTVTAYFSSDLPTEILRSKRDFKDLLTEYRNLAHGQFEFEFIDPSANEELEKEAVEAGIYPVMINVREKDQIKQQKAFLGAIVEKGNKRELIPFLQPNTPVEYALSSAIKKMSNKPRPTIGLLQGHGEPAPYAMQQAIAEMSVIYNIIPINIKENPSLIDSITTLAIIAPIDTITTAEFEAIDNFLAKGKGVFIAHNNAIADLNQLYAAKTNSGIDQWLRQKEISIDNKLAIDNYCATINVTQQQGFYRINVQQQFPYIPFVSNFTNHAITNGLEQVQLAFVSPVVYTGDSTAIYTPLLFTSARSATVNIPTNIDIQRQWQPYDFPLAEIPLGGLIEGHIGNASNAKMIIIGDGDFAINGSPNKPHQQSIDNISLLVNSLDYLSDDTRLIELRTKGITSRPIAQLDDSTRTIIKWCNMLIPIVIVILICIIRRQQQRNLRIKRMEKGYVE